MGIGGLSARRVNYSQKAEENKGKRAHLGHMSYPYFGNLDLLGNICMV